jgi:arylsulfatase
MSSSKSTFIIGFIVCLCLVAIVVGIVFLSGSLSKEPPENVILITIDTLRADHLGCYGYPRATSPAIDRLAEKSVVFDRCVSQATSTLASHASIFTSLYPPSHGVTTNAMALSENIPSLVRVFRDNGYQTGAVVSSIIVRSTFGLDQGFQEYDEELGPPELNREVYRQRRADATTTAALAWLDRNKGEKVFLWIHYIDPHGAYYPPEGYRDLFVNDEWYEEGGQLPLGPSDFVRNSIPSYQALFGIRDPAYYIAQYDAEIRFVDDQLARLLAYLEDSAWMSKTITVITSDHGETLNEREYPFSHGTRTYEEQAVIPLIMNFADSDVTKRIDEQVLALDIMPTLLDKLGMEHLYPIHGSSLMPLIRSGDRRAARPAVVFSDHGTEFYDLQVGAQQSISTGEWKYTQNSWDDTEELYNLEKDPLEQMNLAGQDEETLNRMRTLFGQWEQGIERVPASRPEMTSDFIEQIESLGYVVK